MAVALGFGKPDLGVLTLGELDLGDFDLAAAAMAHLSGVADRTERKRHRDLRVNDPLGGSFRRRHAEKKEGRSRERSGPKSREETPKEGYDAEASRLLT
ncbi:hypothetical protein [Alsobacter metallidurans]|uniref:hypothetical protein n=1 Tax=Alsobacter metallidurans TaxID=340221 RepID=UPI00166C8996|nr:hypothetical protein [Alsobacter metallidurans]